MPVPAPPSPAVQRKTTIASAEAALIHVLVAAQTAASDQAHHRRFVYHSVNFGVSRLPMDGFMRNVGYAASASLNLLHRGNIARGVASLRQAIAMLQAYLRAHPSDAPVKPPTWAESWAAARLHRGNSRVANALALPKSLRGATVKRWATQCTDWLVSAGIISPQFYRGPQVPAFTPSWLAAGSKWRAISLRYAHIARHATNRAEVTTELAAINDLLANG